MRGTSQAAAGVSDPVTTRRMAEASGPGSAAAFGFAAFLGFGFEAAFGLSTAIGSCWPHQCPAIVGCEVGK